MTTSFKVPCPSCEAKVTIKNLSLIGTKVECPKCKYRFKVEEPKDAPKEEKPAEAAAPEPKKGSVKNKKKLVAGVLAVLGVGLLVVGGMAIFGGDDKPKPPGGGGKGGGGGNYNPGFAQGTNPGGEDPNKKDDKTDGKPKEPKKPSLVPYSDKDVTNLLPGASVAVYRFDIERLRITPLGATLFDENTANLFRSSFAAKPDSTSVALGNVEKYFHCIVGEKERAPIGIIRWKDPVAAAEIAVQGAGTAKDLKNYKLLPVSNNAFLTAIGQSLSGRSLFADVYASMPPGAPVKLAACVYDTQHVFVGEAAALEKFLTGLKDGYPEFQTAFKKETPAAPTTPMPKGPTPAGGPGVGAASLPPPGMQPMPMPMAPAPNAPAQPASTGKEYTSNPTYLSVSGDLKRLINSLDEVQGDPPIILLAEKFDNAIYPRGTVKKDYEGLAKLLNPVLDRTAYIGMNLLNFTPRQCELTVKIIGKSAEAAKQVAIDHLTPTLNDGVPILSLLLDTNFVLRNYADPNAKPPEVPGGAGPMAPGGNSGSPGTGAPPPMAPPPSGGSSLGPPPGGGSSLGPPPGGGSSLGPPPGGPKGPMGYGPGPMGSGPGPMGAGPGPMGNPPQMTNPGNPDSRIELRLVDMNVTIHVTVNWTDDVYGRVIVPRLFGFANQVKGKTSVYAGSTSWNGLSAAIQAYVKQNNRFPAATMARSSDTSRLGLSYPPIQRLSFFTELLPFLNRGNVGNSVVPTAAWFDAANLPAAESWVPEFLVDYYDQSAWRAASPLAPDRVLGGTNFVAVAGVGRDAARFDPKNPAQAKLVGLSGYDWGSPVAEATDGLANTIYLMQMPPKMTRPWAAGGGATALGLDPADPIADFKHQRPDGQWGTYAIMGDGVVRWIPATIKPADLLALATRAGGEKLSGTLDSIAPRRDGKTAESKTDVKLPMPEPKAKPSGPLEPAPAPRVKQ
jgi:hypothetical protein